MSEGTHFVDYVRVHIRAGDGGNGCVSFLRAKNKPMAGPDGGDGGRGGSVILEASRALVTLTDFKTNPHIVAKRGGNGGGKDCTGRGGQDVVLKVPLGTIAIDAGTQETLGDLTQQGQQLVVAKGGDGGYGNARYVTATNKAPRKALDGWPGEERNLVLELKIIADAGLVGLPNAGKSTLLAALTDANPRIAPYPFTTVSPNLGVFLATDQQRRVTLADIPGLIEGAHTGQGLGDRFLRHIERTRVLVHLVAPDAGDDDEGNPILANPSPDAIHYAWKLVREELSTYSAGLAGKPSLLCLNKTDLMTTEEIDAIVECFREREGLEIIPVSAGEGIALEELRTRIEKLVYPEDQEDVIFP